jgi:predicted DNA-binding ribbon-helix-helix protein
MQLQKQPVIVEDAIRDTPRRLRSRNVRIHRRRTSVRLEPEMWQALNDIASKEALGIHALCTVVYDMKEAGASFTSALRTFIVEYYRSPDKLRASLLYARNQVRSQPLSPERQSC